MTSAVLPETISTCDPGQEQFEAILKARAENLASNEVEGLAAKQHRRLVVIKLGNETFGIDIANTREIQPLNKVAVIPCTPDWVVGAVNIRGTVTTVIDVRRFFAMPSAQLLEGSKVVVINCADMEFGILADDVCDVLDVPAEAIEPPLATMSGAREEYISGVAPNTLVILDVEALARDGRLTIHEEVS